MLKRTHEVPALVRSACEKMGWDPQTVTSEMNTEACEDGKIELSEFEAINNFIDRRDGN